MIVKGDGEYAEGIVSVEYNRFRDIVKLIYPDGSQYWTWIRWPYYQLIAENGEVIYDSGYHAGITSYQNW